MPEDKPASDFRYATGEARVPWAAVGEHLDDEDLMRLVEFLARPEAGQEEEYEGGLQKMAQ